MKRLFTAWKRKSGGLEEHSKLGFCIFSYNPSIKAATGANNRDTARITRFVALQKQTFTETIDGASAAIN